MKLTRFDEPESTPPAVATAVTEYAPAGSDAEQLHAPCALAVAVHTVDPSAACTFTELFAGPVPEIVTLEPLTVDSAAGDEITGGARVEPPTVNVRAGLSAELFPTASSPVTVTECEPVVSGTAGVQFQLP